MSCSSCNCNPCQCNCSCDPDNEALSSAFATFSADFIGPITKSCVNGEVVWTLPCGLDSDEPVTGIPKLTDESIFCYFLRVLQIVSGEISAFVLPLAIASGGTGGTTAAEARTNLGLEIGVNVQAWDTQLDTWATITPGAGVATFLATPSSANLAAAVTGETGTGGLVFAQTPTLINPATLRQTLSDGATVNWDMNLGGCAVLTIAGSRTMAAPTNLQAGATYIIEVIQGGAGSNTLTWNAVFKFTGAVAPTLSTGVGDRDLLAFYCNGTELISNTSILNDV